MDCKQPNFQLIWQLLAGERGRASARVGVPYPHRRSSNNHGGEVADGATDEDQNSSFRSNKSNSSNSGTKSPNKSSSNNNNSEEVGEVTRQESTDSVDKHLLYCLHFLVAVNDTINMDLCKYVAALHPEAIHCLHESDLRVYLNFKNNEVLAFLLNNWANLKYDDLDLMEVIRTESLTVLSDLRNVLVASVYDAFKGETVHYTTANVGTLTAAEVRRKKKQLRPVLEEKLRQLVVRRTAEIDPLVFTPFEKAQQRAATELQEEFDRILYDDEYRDYILKLYESRTMSGLVSN